MLNKGVVNKLYSDITMNQCSLYITLISEGNNYKTLETTQNRLMNSYNANIEKMIEDNADRVKKLDEELGNELNKSLNTLGNQLASLSNHFVSDYTPLTKRLREVLEIAKPNYAS